MGKYRKHVICNQDRHDFQKTKCGKTLLNAKIWFELTQLHYLTEAELQVPSQFGNSNLASEASYDHNKLDSAIDCGKVQVNLKS